MDKFHKSYSIKHCNQRISFYETTSPIICENLYDGHSAEEFVKYFSIDDDDVVRLDQSETILYEVKSVINHLIDTIVYEQSQIKNSLNKHPLDLNNEQHISNKKVRSNILDGEGQQISTNLFVSETRHSTNHLKPYARFLYHLGLDLCLKQTCNENKDLSESERKLLINQNEVFYHHQIYSCKYCSFKTNTIHVMDYHYRTPHTLSNPHSRQEKYRCTYCSFKTFHIPQLRRHFDRKHGYILATEPPSHRYLCSFCSYETDDKMMFFKHDSRCQIEQKRTSIANNLLQPVDLIDENNSRQMNSFKTKLKENNKKKQTKKAVPLNYISHGTENFNNDIIETIIIESDHDSSSLSRLSSSDEDFIVSSDKDSSSDEHSTDPRDPNFDISTSRPKKSQNPTVSRSVPVQSNLTSSATTLSSLSKLLLLNGASISPLTPLPINSVKPSLVPIQPKPTLGMDIYQMCNICQCYVFKKDFNTHMNEKHPHPQTHLQPIMSTPLTVLNDTVNSINTPITDLTPAVVTAKIISQPPPIIFLLATSTMGPQSVKLDMIKCPWCDTNFEHIEIITGHLMRYHRMTVAAAKVVVAEQMKIQGTSSSQLSLMFKKEIEQIQREFTDKTYWKISQPKVYLHQFENLTCFVCNENIDDIESHFKSVHQIKLITLNKIKQCCLCGFHSNKKASSLYEHQLRTHSGVCYSSILQQFIRFEPPPPPPPVTLPPKSIPPKSKNQAKASSNSLRKGQSLTTVTEKKFGCRKCGPGSHLFTFEELVEHLRSVHKLIVKLQRRCVICQETFPKGKEYNQHCLEHISDENPRVKIKRLYNKR